MASAGELKGGVPYGILSVPTLTKVAMSCRTSRELSTMNDLMSDAHQIINSILDNPEEESLEPLVLGLIDLWMQAPVPVPLEFSKTGTDYLPSGKLEASVKEGSSPPGLFAGKPIPLADFSVVKTPITCRRVLPYYGYLDLFPDPDYVDDLQHGKLTTLYGWDAHSYLHRILVVGFDSWMTHRVDPVTPYPLIEPRLYSGRFVVPRPIIIAGNSLLESRSLMRDPVLRDLDKRLWDAKETGRWFASALSLATKEHSGTRFPMVKSPYRKSTLLSTKYGVSVQGKAFNTVLDLLRGLRG